MNFNQISIQYGPAGGDCTYPYYVALKKEMTVQEFIDTWTVGNTGEWGNIDVYCIPEDPEEPEVKYRLEYSHGKIKSSNIPENWLKEKILRVEGQGGWSCSDFQLQIRDMTKPSEFKKERQVEMVMLCNQCNHRMVCKFNNEDLANGIEEASKVLQQYIGEDSPIIFSTACQEYDFDPTTNEAKDLCF